jgi:outer membrane receptor for ferrienterochelin and colicins
MNGRYTQLLTDGLPLYGGQASSIGFLQIFEAYYTGGQRLENNPYRASGRPYVEMGILGEIVLGKVRLFLNMENILNVRQTKYDSLLLPRQLADGAWTVDAWAPTEGFVANGGIRLAF